jgi:hypothetical protein
MRELLQAWLASDDASELIARLAPLVANDNTPTNPAADIAA